MTTSIRTSESILPDISSDWNKCTSQLLRKNYYHERARRCLIAYTCEVISRCQEYQFLHYGLLQPLSVNILPCAFIRLHTKHVLNSMKIAIRFKQHQQPQQSNNKDNIISIFNFSCLSPPLYVSDTALLGSATSLLLN